MIFGDIRSMLTEIPMLRAMVERELAESFDLKNRITIEVATANFRTVRGYTTVAALCDEVAHWPTDDSSNPDAEVLAAIAPSMLTIPNSTLLVQARLTRKRVHCTTHIKTITARTETCWSGTRQP